MLEFDFIDSYKLSVAKGITNVRPYFKSSKKVKDLVVRGGKFIALFNPKTNLYLKNYCEALSLIDESTDERYGKQQGVNIIHLSDPSTKMSDEFDKLCKMLYNCGPDLDRKVIFANTEVTKEDGATFKLPYAIENKPTPNYDYAMSIWYDPTERQKLEWAIGAVISGDSRTSLVDHFIVMYGMPRTGKGTVIKIINALFRAGKDNGYSEEIKLRNLASGSQFALQQLRNNPLVAIDSDADLSYRNAKAIDILNTITSHEQGRMELKGRDDYEFTFESLIFAATNVEVEISGEMSGLNRRLIDVYPTGNIIESKEYHKIMNAIFKFELGGIAYKCLDLYLNNKHLYDGYAPTTMREKSDWCDDFVHENEDALNDPEGVYISYIYNMLYKPWCQEHGFDRYIKTYKELENMLTPYFVVHKSRPQRGQDQQNRPRGYFQGLKYLNPVDNVVRKEKDNSWLDLEDHGKETSVLDDICKDCLAQYDRDGHPAKAWANTTSTLKDLNPRHLHWVQVHDNLVVIDFDIKDEYGNKSFKLNRQAVIDQGWPETYAEVSQGGEGIHLCYFYSGDLSELERVYSENVEIKVYTGNSSLRRKLRRWNQNDISTLNDGQLPKKEKKEVKNDTVDKNQIKSEKKLRELIIRNLNKDIHPGTKPSMDFIKKILDDAYASGLVYDVTDMRSDIWDFASKSTHQANYCMSLIDTMHFASETEKNLETKNNNNDILLTFFDVEVFPNLFVVVYKHQGEDCVKLINPSPSTIRDICEFNLVGFNCRKYDNHIMYARMMGESIENLYTISTRLVNKKDSYAGFREAYDLSYTDIYDFSSVKQGLKKFEIELGIHHKELGLPWDQPVPEELWETVADYCINDVLATEATFNARLADFKARQILVEVANRRGARVNVNSTTNQLTTKIIFGSDKNPQYTFNYRNLADEVDNKPCFKGYSFENGVSTYKGVSVGEGGRVFANPGMYKNVKCYDVAGMHPSSIIAEDLFGVYTKNFKDIVDARVAIKHKDFDKAKNMLDGALAPYLDNENDAKALSKALKIAVNSVYGLTAAKFDNAFRDPRNIDNIVAKRGALFMVDLQEAVEQKGFTVVHIKTDSIKVADPTPELENFIFEFGKKYGYNFEIEHSFEKICLVNDAVYIAKCAEDDPESPGQWTATGAQFAVPYIFKKLFSKEEIGFDDLCETKSVQDPSAIYLQFDENNRKFVGKVGQFCPVIFGGADLVRSQILKGVLKYNAVTGTKGYKWLESETVRLTDGIDIIDISYYDKLADEAVATINKFGNFNDFID